MKRSAFLWLTAAASLALSAMHRAQRVDPAIAGPPRMQRSRIARQAGRCFASRRGSRWSAFTLHEILA